MRVVGAVAAGDGLVDAVRVVTEAALPVEVDLSQAQLADWSVIGFLARLALALRPARVTVTGVGPHAHDMIIKARLDRHLVVVEVDITKAHATVDLRDSVTLSAPVRFAQRY